MEIECLNLCLSKTGLNLFEVSLMPMVNFRQGESSGSGRGMKVERRTSILNMYFLKQHFLEFLLLETFFIWRDFLTEPASPGTLFLYLLLLATATNPWFKAATYQITMLIELQEQFVQSMSM